VAISEFQRFAAVAAWVRSAGLQALQMRASVRRCFPQGAGCHQIGEGPRNASDRSKRPRRTQGRDLIRLFLPAM